MLDGLKMEGSLPHSDQTPASLHGPSGKERAVCEGCDRVILDRFLLRVNDSFWHEQCVQCVGCREPLATTCYYRDKKLYCKHDYENMMLKQANKNLNNEDGVYIRYHTDGSLFNLRRLQAHTKTQEQLVRELLFADDAALVAHSEPALQRMTSCFVETIFIQWI